MKSKCKSARIPETVHYEQRYRSNCSTQAEMFNEYFSKQFSEPSVYDTDIYFKNACALNNLQFHKLDIWQLNSLDICMFLFCCFDIAHVYIVHCTVYIVQCTVYIVYK